MSSTRKEIVFSARDNGVADLMSRLRQSANELGDELIREAQQNSQNAREAVQYVEQQIKLLERRNKLEAKQRQAALDKRYQELSQVEGVDQKSLRQQYRQQVSELRQASKEDQIQIDLLRELIETVKRTGQQEIKAETANSVREQAAMDRRNLEQAGGSYVLLADALADENDEQTSSGGSGRGGGGGKKNTPFLVRTAQSARRFTNSSDGVSAVNQELEHANDIPFVGILTGIIGAAVGALAIRAQRENSATSYAALSGMSVDEIIDGNIGKTGFGEYGPRRLGVSREDFLSQLMPSIIRARGSSAGAYEATMGALELEKSTGTSQSTIGTLEKLTRVLSHVSSSQQLTTRVFSSLYNTGVFGKNNDDMARMDAVASGFANFQTSLLMSSGATSMTGTLGLMRHLSRMGGNFASDDYMFDTMNRLNTGLTSAGSPEAQAIKFDVLRRQNPNKSYFELQMEMEKGVASKGYLSGLFDFVKSSGGDLNSQALLFDSLTGGSMRKKDIWDLLSGTKSLKDIDLGAKQHEIDYKGRALQSSSGAQSELLNFSEKFKDMISPIGEDVERIVRLLDKLVGKLD